MSSLDALTGNLDDINRRLSSLEQGFSSAGSLPPSPVVVSPPFGGPPLVLAGPEAGPANFHLSHHLSGSVITVEAEWSPVADAVIYEIEWATKNSDGTYTLVNSLRTVGTSAPFSLLAAATTYGFKVYAINNFGQYSLSSPSTGYLDITTSTDSVPPPAPANVRLARGQTSVIVRFDPYDPTVVTDLQSYHIALSSDGFLTQLDIYTTAFVVQFPNLEMGTKEWVARVSGIDTSSNEGPYSTSTNFPVSNSGGIVDQMMVGDFSAAHITFGSMLGDRIQTNSLSAQTLKTSSLTASDITLNGGAFIVGNPIVGTGMLINSQGIRLYNSGAIEVALDALTGSATFSGTITGATINGGTINGATISGIVLNGITINGSTINGSTINSSNFSLTSGTVYANIEIITKGGSSFPGLLLGDTAYDSSGGFIGALSGSGFSSCVIGAPQNFYSNPCFVELFTKSSDPFTQLDIFTNRFSINDSPTSYGPGVAGGLQTLYMDWSGSVVWRTWTFELLGRDSVVYFKADKSAARFDFYGDLYGYSFVVTSSRTLKQNITKIEDSVLPGIRALTPSTFEFAAKPGQRIGLIAEEVNEQWPQATAELTNVEGKKESLVPAIDLPAMVSLLVKATQELDQRVTTLEVLK